MNSVGEDLRVVYYLDENKPLTCFQGQTYRAAREFLSLEKRIFHLLAVIGLIALGILTIVPFIFKLFREQIGFHVRWLCGEALKLSSKEALSLMRGERMPFKDSIPEAFVKDYYRQDMILNKEVMYERGGSANKSLEETVSVLYNFFGKTGSERIMLLCNQCVLASPMNSIVKPLIEQEGIWGRGFPDELLMFSQESRLFHEIIREGEEVRLSSKVLMELVAESGNKGRYFVVQTTLQIPYDLLVSDEFLDIEPDDPRFFSDDAVIELTASNLK